MFWASVEPITRIERRPHGRLQDNSGYGDASHRHDKERAIARNAQQVEITGASPSCYDHTIISRAALLGAAEIFPGAGMPATF